jgi:uncharacterized UPF0160 family protein
MIKKSLSILAVTALLSVNLSAFSFGNCNFSSITSPVKQNDLGIMEANAVQSEELRSMSSNLLSISLALQNSATSDDLSYINAMLRLSDDIGTMADRIGEMADRIVATELQIGDMADRILETQTIQNVNIANTQANLLKAQENLNKPLTELTD